MTADGSKGRLLLGLEQRLYDSAGTAIRQTGVPRFHLVEVAAPTLAPTVTPGSAGNVTGGGTSYKFSRVTVDRGETECSPASVPQAVSSKQVAISDLVWSADSAVDGLRVYRRLDTVGANLVTNGDFPTDLTGWTGTNWAQAATKALHTAGNVAALTQSIAVTSGAKYQVIFTVSGRTAGTITAAIGAAAGSARSADGTYCEYITALATGSIALTFTPSSPFDGNLDDISVKEITTEGEWLHVGTVWDSTHVTTTFADDLAPGSEDTDTAPQAANQTVLNYGLRQFPGDPGEIFEVNATEITPNEATGYLGEPEPVQLRLQQMAQGSASLRAGHLVAYEAAFMGAPTVTRSTTEPVRTYDFTATDEPAAAVSLCGIHHMGGSATRPIIGQGIRISELEIGSPGNTELQVKYKGPFVGTSYDSPGVPAIANTGTIALAPVLRGLRALGDYSEAITMEVVAAASGGTFTVKFKKGSGAWGPTTTMYYRTATGRVYRYGAQVDAACEVLIGASSDHLGVDTDRDFEPVFCLFPGDVRDLDAGDQFVFSEALIPGPESGSAYSGEALVTTDQAIYTPARVRVYRGFVSASEYYEFEAATVKRTRALKVNAIQGPAFKAGTTVTTAGFVSLELGTTRLLDSRDFERWARASRRLAWDVQISGPKIWTNPGTWSTSRELIRFEIPVGSHIVKRAVGAGEIKETLTVRARQPQDGSPHFTSQIVTGMGWDFAAIA